MSGFALALAVFVLIHIGISATGLRTRLVGRIGVGPYRIAFFVGFAGAAALADPRLWARCAPIRSIR